MPGRRGARAPKKSPAFDLHKFLDAAGLERTIFNYSKGGVVYSQGEPVEQVMYIQQGNVKISVVSKAGKEAIVGLLDGGDFFGEGCRAGWRRPPR